MKTNKIFLMLALALLIGKDAAAGTIAVTSSQIEWIGRKVTGEHTGTIQLKSGQILTNETNQLSGGEFTIDMTTIKNLDITDPETNAKLVNHLSSDDFFGINTFKTATLKITSLNPKGKNDFDVVADVTIKGMTHPVSFVATKKAKDDGDVLSAKIMLDRTKWNIRYGSGKFFENLGNRLIDDMFEIKVNLTIPHSPASSN